jgi:hypothetical protein
MQGLLSGRGRGTGAATRTIVLVCTPPQLAGRLVFLQVMLPSFWVASTKSEVALARSQG